MPLRHMSPQPWRANVLSIEHHREGMDVPVSESEVPGALGSTLVLTAVTSNADLQRRLLQAANVDRLNLGPIPTNRIGWDQPHEGNLFEHLYSRRAIQRAG